MSLDKNLVNNAKNELLNGLKEGLWIEYWDDYTNFFCLIQGMRQLRNNITSDAKAPYYILTVYRADKPKGIVQGYYRNGKLYFEIPTANGQKNGVQKVYKKSGKIFLETPFINDKKSGIEKYHNVKTGAFEKYNLEVPYADDKKNGIGKAYKKNGKLYCETTYLEGKMNGVEKVYYKSGGLKREVNYTDDLKNGLEKVYYKSGELFRETLYSKGKQSEKLKVFTKSGKTRNILNISKYALLSGIIKFAAVIILIIAAIFNNEYSFYTFVRWYIMLSSVVLVSTSIERNQDTIVFFFIGVAILFNPFVEFGFQKITWLYIDFIVASILFCQLLIAIFNTIRHRDSKENPVKSE